MSSSESHGPADGAREVRVGEWQVDITAGTLRRSGEVVRLEPKVMDVLARLLRADGAVVSKDDLLDSVWPDAVVEEAALSRCVSELRRALGDDARNPSYVETLPKRGYRLTATVGATRASGGSWQLALPWVLVALVAATLLVATWYRRTTASAEAGDIRSVAVLPVENLTGDAAQDYFAEGITDGLITELGRLRAFERVTSRFSAVGFDRAAISLAEIGARLGVDGIVEASLLSTADAVRLNVRLVHTGSDSQVWSGSLEGKPTDVAVLYREVARALVAGIGAQSPAERDARAQRAVDPLAYAAYVRGRHFWSQRTAEGYERAAEYFKQAIAIDDQYAAAYAGLADNVLMAEQPSRVASSREARNYAVIALGIDNSLAEAHTTLAFIAAFEWQWQAAEEGFRTAIELNPSYVTAHHWYGLLLSWLGRFDEAEAQLVRARQLDPLTPVLVSAHAAVGINAGRFEQVVRIAEEGLALDPSFYRMHTLLSTAYAALGQYDEAIASARTLVAAEDSPTTRAVLARVYAAAGRDAEAERMLVEFEALGDGAWREQDLTFYVAEIYAALGERELALEHLRQSYEEGSDNIVALAVSPWLASVRDDPRFHELLVRMGLR